MCSSDLEKGTFTDPKIMVPQVSEKLKTVIDKSLRLNISSRISAAEIEKLLNDEQYTEQVKPVRQNPIQLNLSRKNLVIAGIAVFVIIITIFIVTNPAEKEVVINNNEDPVKTQKGAEAGDIEKLTIATPSVPNAYIVFQDGSTQNLPYDISGTDGQNFKFTIKAEGYISREIEVPITNRRKSYQYYLEKVKE